MNTKHNPSKDVYQLITDKMIARLEQGFIPWKKPWAASGAACNYISKKPYRGINAILLNFCADKLPYYLTFKQAVELGGKVIKGSKAEMVTYWNWLYADKATGRKLTPEQARVLPAGNVKKMAFLKYYNVFSISDIEGIEFKTPELKERPQHEKIALCEAIIEQMPSRPKLQFGGDKAYYSPLQDLVNMPFICDFDSAGLYYSVYFHELVHATGHTARLNREEVNSPNKFGSEPYSREELTAEMGATFLCNMAGIEQDYTFENSAAYIQNWLQVLKNDKKFVIEAASKAQAAADFILNQVAEEVQESA